MLENNICPCCGRHCDLKEPHCKRGEEYAKTGKMPKQGYGKKHDHEMHMEHYHSLDMNEQLIINLRNLGHMMRLLYEGKASQKRILIILDESGTTTQRDLTERLGIQPGSASEILSKLENTGLIIRTQNEDDRRTTDICLTDKGKEMAGEALAQRQKRHEEMFSCLSKEERQELLSLMERVCADWKTRCSEKENAHAHGQHHNSSYNGHHHGQRHHGGFHGHGGN